MLKYRNDIQKGTQDPRFFFEITNSWTFFTSPSNLIYTYVPKSKIYLNQDYPLFAVYFSRVLEQFGET